MFIILALVPLGTGTVTCRSCSVWVQRYLSQMPPLWIGTAPLPSSSSPSPSPLPLPFSDELAASAVGGAAAPAFSLAASSCVRTERHALLT